jgi:hypothetical protein
MPSSRSEARPASWPEWKLVEVKLPNAIQEWIIMENQPGKTALPRILFAHPERSFTRIVAQILQEEYEIIEANTAEDALALLNQDFAVIVITKFFLEYPD